MASIKSKENINVQLDQAKKPGNFSSQLVRNLDLSNLPSPASASVPFPKLKKDILFDCYIMTD